ncbi:MAG: PHP domain-containing protein [Clostridia bacterium]|nr:PHP domain-containing protein [Clostridia bacterium]
MIRADLHIHTTASDGTDDPASIGLLSSQSGLKWAAVTDHDTVDGIPGFIEGCCQEGIETLCGAEVSTGPKGRTHVLCYFKYKDLDRYEKYFSGIRDKRIERAWEMVAALRRMGMDLDTDKIFSSSSSVGRPLIAREMVDKGYVATVAEAFQKYIGDGGPAYAPLPALSTSAAVKKIRDMGGVPVLAHPVQMKLSGQELYQTVKELKQNGLLGLEVYHPDQQSDYSPYRSLAESEGLLKTGGSDYHGKNKDIALGCTSGAWPDAQKNIDRILELLNR